MTAFPVSAPDRADQHLGPARGMEPLHDPGPARNGQRTGAVGIVGQRGDGPRQRGRVLWRHQNAVNAIADQFRHAAGIGADGGNAAGHRLHHRDRGRFALSDG